MTWHASRELRNCWWEADACSCWYIIRTGASTCSRWSLSECRVGSNSGLDLLVVEMSPRSRRENLWSFFHGLQSNQPPRGLLEMQNGSWRRKEENNCMRLCSLVFPVLPRLHLKSLPPYHLLCSRSPSWTSLSTQLVVDRIIVQVLAEHVCLIIKKHFHPYLCNCTPALGKGTNG